MKHCRSMLRFGDSKTIPFGVQLVNRYIGMSFGVND